MSWGNPWMLFALLLPAATAWLVRRSQRDARPLWPAMRRVWIGMDNGISPAAPRRLTPAWLIIAAIAAGIIALARPQWGEREELSFSQTREVMIALDLSRSMWAEDMPGGASRLRVAKAMAGELLDNLRGENTGLVPFAGTAFVQVPKSPDYQIIREFLPGLDPNYMPKGGSDYNRMLDAALQGFGDEVNDRDRYLIVLSDGESTTEGWERRVPDLLRHNIHVIGIGFGSEKGAGIPDQKGGQLSDGNGAPVVSKLTPATLQGLAERTGGRYLAATSLPDTGAVRRLIQDTVETGRPGHAGGASTNIGVDRFQWFLAPAVLLALLSLVREFRRHPRPRRIRPTMVTALALLAFVAATPRADAHHDAEAGFEVKREFSGDPIGRVRAIATHLGRFGYDPFDLQLLVEASIRYGANERSRGRLPMQGVMRDAVDAAHMGKKLNPALGPWDNYESQIRRLLAPLPVQAQDKPQEQNSDDEDDDDEQNYKPVPLRKAKDKTGDPYNRNSSVKKEFALGDLSANENFMPQETHGPKRRPPRPAPQPIAAPGSSAAEDPAMILARHNAAAVVKADSPARVHQLLAGDKQTTAKQDW